MSVWTGFRDKVTQRRFSLLLITICLNVLCWGSALSLVLAVYLLVDNPQDTTLMFSTILTVIGSVLSICHVFMHTIIAMRENSGSNPETKTSLLRKANIKFKTSVLQRIHEALGTSLIKRKACYVAIRLAVFVCILWLATAGWNLILAARQPFCISVPTTAPAYESWMSGSRCIVARLAFTFSVLMLITSFVLFSLLATVHWPFEATLFGPSTSVNPASPESSRSSSRSVSLEKNRSRSGSDLMKDIVSGSSSASSSPTPPPPLPHPLAPAIEPPNSLRKIQSAPDLRNGRGRQQAWPPRARDLDIPPVPRIKSIYMDSAWRAIHPPETAATPSRRADSWTPTRRSRLYSFNGSTPVLASPGYVVSHSRPYGRSYTLTARSSTQLFPRVDNDTQSFRDSIYRDSVYRDSAYRDSAYRDSTYRDSVYRDPLYKESLRVHEFKALPPLPPIARRTMSSVSMRRQFTEMSSSPAPPQKSNTVEWSVPRRQFPCSRSATVARVGRATPTVVQRRRVASVSHVVVVPPDNSDVGNVHRKSHVGLAI